MDYLLFLLRRAVMFPLGILTSPTQGLRSVWSESHRNKALLLGMPALLVALLALGVVSYCQLSNPKNLEDRYKLKYDKVTASIRQLTGEIIRQRQVRASGDSAEADLTLEEQKLEELRELKQAQKIYLDKLITIAPDNNAHRFELVKLVANQNDPSHALSLLNELAPEDSPGYPRAHFQLANRYFTAPARTRMELVGNLDLALLHINHALTRDDEDPSAKRLKAQILVKSERYTEAYEIYEKLFESNPNYYRQLTKLNELLKREERDESVLEDALLKFQQLSNDQENRDDSRRWEVIQTGITQTQSMLKQWNAIEDRLTEEIAKFPADGDPDTKARRTRLKELLAASYIAWAEELTPNSITLEEVDQPTQMRLLEIYRKAFFNNPKNSRVLEALTRLTLSEFPNVASAALEVYDPNSDDDPPAAVLNQQGNEALLSKRFDEAIKYYERARNKTPNSAAILNNLAYSYLVAKENNAELALQRINEALRSLPQDLDPEERSKFLHTKGTALKQLNRQQEAISSFEKAIQARPDHEDTLRSLIECYRALDLEPPEQYIRRFEAIRQEALQP
jgi:tetratricopeptide (TPR) repeat protein